MPNLIYSFIMSGCIIKQLHHDLAILDMLYSKINRVKLCEGNEKSVPLPLNRPLNFVNTVRVNKHSYCNKHA